MECNLGDSSTINFRSFAIEVFHKQCFSLSQNLIRLTDSDKISSYADIFGDILKNLEFDLKNILMWFNVNSLKPNPCKFHFLL